MLIHPRQVGPHAINQGATFDTELVEVMIAVGETVILLHPLLPSAGVSVGMKRGSSKMTVSPTDRR